jgi:hypothetical protein
VSFSVNVFQNPVDDDQVTNHVLPHSLHVLINFARNAKEHFQTHFQTRSHRKQSTFGSMTPQTEHVWFNATGFTLARALVHAK